MSSDLVEKLLAASGRPVLKFLEESGRILLLLLATLRQAFVPPLRLRLIVSHLLEIGVRSIPVVVITASFTGMVLALQTYTGFRRFGAESLMGSLVALSMTRELGPVLTGLIVAGRAGSAMAAELGTMRVTEQIDALTTLAVNPVKYLVVPRFLASMIALPILTLMADALGIFGGYAIATSLLRVNPVSYSFATFEYLRLEDITSGLTKSCFFGMIIGLIGCYKGFATSGGAEGVGRATTSAVVVAMMLILVANYLLTALLF
jgi:phospholipid/cholesterol/gamma-HCH transport system permease protein